ncbi:MAG: hypothetical protein QNJ48_09745 [Desulfobacterales bacterium]|nr:hypothetical protein [Desulfobacterales bacterium]
MNTLPDHAPTLWRKMWRWFRRDVLGLIQEMRWSYLPPLMVYFAAGVSGFTGIIESFFVKEQLGLSAAFLAGLGFWAGLPWALKMPVGHLVDLFWRWKAAFVYLGAALMATSLLIMVGLTGHTEQMAALLPVNTWYVLSVMLAPLGYVLQDVVADAMTVEAVPTRHNDGTPIPEARLQQMHVTMQTLGRVAIIGGSATVAGTGGWLATVLSYELMYRIALVIPLISVSGVLLAAWQRRQSERGAATSGRALQPRPEVSVNLHILWGSAAFVAVSLAVGLSSLTGKEEIIFIGSLGIVGYLMRQVLAPLAPDKRREIIGIAVIVFIFRAMPTAGAGAGWWQIDVLGFDEAFFGTLRQISALLTIGGLLALRGWMGRRSLPYVVVFLSIYSAFMMLPFIGMYYGLHEWTTTHLGFGARTIAIIDTMADAPMGQVVMVPMLAWIAREAPANQKATYFAVMAAFTNLALSASHLGTRYLNQIFVIERGQYADLGALMITVALLALALPILAVTLFRPHPPDGRRQDMRPDKKWISPPRQI